jgi:cytochrome c oxidase subunit IV
MSMLVFVTDTIPKLHTDFSLRADIALTVFLILVLIEHELVRSYFGKCARERVLALQVVALPLLAAFVLVVADRWAQLR